MAHLRPLFIAAAVAGRCASPLSAAAFSGSLLNTNPPAAAGGRCAPSSTVSISPTLGTSSGSSNFGAFAATMSHCIDLPLPATYTNGLFSFDFGAGDLLTGTYSGALTASATAGEFNNLENYIVTGGTGRFSSFAGLLTGSGTVTFAPGAAPVSRQTITGTVAAVPEPGSWSMMLLGFGAVGYTIRRRAKLVQKNSPGQTARAAL